MKKSCSTSVPYFCRWMLMALFLVAGIGQTKAETVTIVDGCSYSFKAKGTSAYLSLNGTVKGDNGTDVSVTLLSGSTSLVATASTNILNSGFTLGDGSGKYMCMHSGDKYTWDACVSAVHSASVWYVESVTEDNELYYRLRCDRGYLGCDASNPVGAKMYCNKAASGAMLFTVTQTTGKVRYVILNEGGSVLKDETLLGTIGQKVQFTFDYPYTTLDKQLGVTVEAGLQTVYATASVSSTLPFALSNSYEDATWYDENGVTSECYAYVGTPWEGIKRYAYSAGSAQTPTDVDLSTIASKTYQEHSFAGPFTITYVYNYKGQEWARTEKAGIAKNSAYPTPAAPYGVRVSGMPTGTVTANRVVTLECELDGNLPFTFYSDFESIKSWYNLKITKDELLIHSTESASYMTLHTSQYGDYDYDFGFVGNPLTGFTIYHKNTTTEGHPRALGSRIPTYLPSGKSSTTGQYACVMSLDMTDVPSDYSTKWDVYGQGNIEGTIYLAYHGTGYCLNKRDDSGNGNNVLAYWNDNQDSGSSIYVVSSIKDFASELENGKIYMLNNVKFGLNVTADYLNGKNMIGTTTPDNVYCQYWKATVSDGKVAWQNVFTGEYIQNYSGVSQPFVTGTSPYYFTIADVTDPVSFEFKCGGGTSLHMDASKNLVGWYSGGNNASYYRLEEVSMTAEEQEQVQLKYQKYIAEQNSYENLKAHEAEMTALLMNYFEDYACTQLKAQYRTMSDEALSQALNEQNVPTTIIQMVLKVKNNAWTQYVEGNEMLNEKFFRVQDYQIYSDEWKWCDNLGASNARGRWSNPVGVIIPKQEMAYVYVDQDVPAGATLQLNGILGTDTGIRSWDLHKGLNVVRTTEIDRLYIYYKMDDLDASGNPQLLANFPKIKIHIEGGYVNGYWDKTRGMTNTEWQQMQAHEDLLTYKYMDIKGDYMCMLMNAQKVFEACPNNIEGTMSVWDHIVKEEYRIMGVYYEPNGYEARFNNVMNGFSVTYNYMYASTYGGWYNESTLGTIMNAEEMLQGGGALWGPAHEMGHNNQAIMNMIGCTEISNNVYSNAVIWQWGTTTTRGYAPQSTFNKFTEGKCWYERDLWERTRLYYQLWQYFYVCKHDENFYPKLFNAFKADPMHRYGGRFCPAEEDELHFAEKVCEVAGEDLTEFFEVYGFFKKPALESFEIDGVTKDAYHVGDYANYYVTFDSDDETWEEKVARTKAKLAAYGKHGAENIMFIEDRIEQTVSDERTAHPGTARQNYESDTAYGKCGDVGSFTQYTAEQQAQADASDYYFTVSGNTVTMTGQGAVGYKIYNQDGTLVALSNSNSFTLSSDMATKVNDYTYTLKVATADGASFTLDEETNTLNKLSSVTTFPNGKYVIKVADEYVYYSGDYLKKGATLTRAQHLFTLTKGTGTYKKCYTITTCTGKYVVNNGLTEGSSVAFASEEEATDANKWWLIYNDAISGQYDILPYQTALADNTPAWNFAIKIDGEVNAGIGLWRRNGANSRCTIVPEADDDINQDGMMLSAAPKASGFDQDTEWYTMKIGYGNVLNYEENASQMNISRTTTSGADSDLWCLVLDEANGGYQFYNRAAGVNKVLASEAVTSSTWASTYARLIALEDVAAGNGTWVVSTGNTIDSQQGYFLGQKSTGFRLNVQNNKLVYWSGADDGSTIRFNHVTVTDPETLTLPVSEAGYATLCLPYDALVPEGVEAYVGSYNEAYSTLHMEQVSALKAGEGYIVKAAEGEYSYLPATETVTAPENNSLKGVTVATDITTLYGAGEAAYLLNYDAERTPQVQFNHSVEGTLAANKACLVLSESADAPQFILINWGDATGLSELEAESWTQKADGKYIENGQLIIVKNGIKYNAKGQVK